MTQTDSSLVARLSMVGDCNELITAINRATHIPEDEREADKELVELFREEVQNANLAALQRMQPNMQRIVHKYHMTHGETHKRRNQG